MEFIPGNGPNPRLNTAPDDCGWEVQMWSVDGDCWIPAGYIEQNYEPYESWKESGEPIRNGFNARLLGQGREEARQFTSFRDAQNWIWHNNPFGLNPL